MISIRYYQVQAFSTDGKSFTKHIEKKMANLWSRIIEQEIASASAITHHYTPTESVIKLLDSGAIYIKSDMDTDADGSPRAKQIDPFGLLATSLSRDNGWMGYGRYLNSETIPYFVLPGKFNAVFGTRCTLGDVALIRRRTAEVSAIYADIGPKTKIGEGSIKLVESLGAYPWNRNKTKIISGIAFGVEYLIFTRSSETFGIPKTFDDIQTVGRQAFKQAFGDV